MNTLVTCAAIVVQMTFILYFADNSLTLVSMLIEIVVFPFTVLMDWLTSYSIYQIGTVISDDFITMREHIEFTLFVYSNTISSHINPMRMLMDMYNGFTDDPFVVDAAYQSMHIQSNEWISGSTNLDTLFMNGGRLLLALVFFGSYILVPIWAWILTLYARIIESDKPVFTVVGAGIGGFASAISALLK
jgi:hypothetical protein